MSLYIAALFLVLFLSLFMILLVGGRMEVRGAVPMLALLSGMCLWTLSQLFHIFVMEPQAKYFWYQAKFAGIVVIPVAFAALAAAITGQTDRIRPWHRRGALLVSLLTLGAVVTDPWLHLFRTEITYVPAERFTLIQSVDGPAFWLFTAYTYGLIGLSITLMARQLRRTEGRERNQIILMLLGSAFPWVWNVLFLLLFQPTLPLDLTPVLMLVTETVFLITLFYYSMFNIVPFTKQAVFESLEDLVLVVDRAGVIQDVNPAALTLYRRPEGPEGLPLSGFMRYLAPGDTPDHFKGYRNGRPRDYRLSRSVIRGRQGGPIGELLVFNDITDLLDSRRTLEMATRELDRQNEKKVLFMKQFNRNIRRPMNRVLGFADALGQEPVSEEQAEILSHLSISGSHLIQLINDITDYSRIETGAMKLMEEPVRVFDLIRHVCRLFEYPAGQKGLKFSYSIEGDMPATVLADPLRLTQILSNVVGNAVKFTESGGITLRVEPDGAGRMVITVQDTGVGIPPEDMDRIFMPYHQAGEAAAARFGGTGLGLAIVKDLVEQMQGTVAVESAVGSGTRFTLRLPCRPLPTEAPVYELGQMSDYRSRSLRLGLVTRDEALQALIPRYLRNWPQAVCVPVEDGAALRTAPWPWDIILWGVDEAPVPDWLMPDSFEPVSGVRPGLILLTGDAEIMEREQLGRGLADDCLLMPITRTDLVKALRKQLLAARG